MQNINDEKSYERFEQSVLESAERQASLIMVKSENYRRDTLRGASVTAPEVLEKKREEILTRAKRKLAKAEQDMRRDLLRYRDELACEFFSDIEKELAQRSSSEQYIKTLAKQLDKFTRSAMRASEEGHSVLLFVRPEDAQTFERLMRREGEFTVCPTRDIKLGGFKLQLGRILHDCTLDAALQRERENFYATSDIGIGDSQPNPKSVQSDC